MPACIAGLCRHISAVANGREFSSRQKERSLLRSIIDDAGIPFKQLLGFLIQIRSHFVDLVFPPTFSTFQAYPTTLPVYFQLTVTFFALHKGTLIV
jgi:hypothetical protein